MIGPLLVDTVEVLQAGEFISRDGTVTDDWTAPISLGTYRAAVQGLTGTDEMGERDGSRARFRIYMLPDTPVTHKVRFNWRSSQLEIVSVPRIVFDMSGVKSHLEITAKEVEG